MTRPRRGASRRRFFRQAVACGLCLPLRPARAAPARWASPEQALEIDLPQLEYPGNWNPRPGAMRELGLELRLRSRLEPRREPSVVRAADERLFDTPFVYIAGRGGFPELGASAVARLRRFVDLGGLLVFDDADGGLDYAMREQVGALVRELLPGRSLAPVPASHVLYRSFYVLESPAGRTRSFDHCLGVADEGRLQVLYLPNDLGGALVRGRDGAPLHPCTPGGEVQREWARRLGVNILLYATCTDYKSDRAHVETLLRRRQWRTE